MIASAAALMTVGEVLRPHGLAGAVWVRPLTDRPGERFGSLEACFLLEEATGQAEPCHILGSRVEGDAVVVRIAGVDSPEAARRLRGRLLAIERERALPAGPGRFYPWQMAGAVVETVAGGPVGRFLRVEEGAGQDVWVIGEGTREWLVPAVPEIVVDVSVADRRIVIDPPEGLLDL